MRYLSPSAPPDHDTSFMTPFLAPCGFCAPTMAVFAFSCVLQQIGCDNEDCEHGEWFHYKCVGLEQVVSFP